SPGNLNKITPDDLEFKILSEPVKRMYAGQIIRYKIKPLLNIPMTWVTEITQVESKQFFIDEQRFGPYKFWHHQHHFKQTEEGVLMTDILHYSLYGGFLGNFLNNLFIRKKIEGIFTHRTKVIDKLFSKREAELT
ncbi:MAG: SRPBCC family protein, partial [Bacteroidia bacterium]|nr:SRPBCC family protein [Bacteroidia bacterium]